MRQVLFGGNQGNSPSAASTTHNPIQGSAAWVTPGGAYDVLFSPAGTLGTLRVAVSAAPGAGNSLQFVVLQNGVASALSVTISDAETSGSDTINTLTITPGDRISLRCIPTSSPTVSGVVWSSAFTGDVANQSVLAGGTAGNLISNGGVEFGMLALADVATAAEVDHEQLIPTPGTIRNLYVRTSATPLAVGSSYTFVVRRNGVDTTLLCVVTQATNLCNDLANSFTVAAGDVISIESTPAAGPRAVTVAWGCTFVADTDDESLVFGQGIGLDDTDTEFTPLAKNDDAAWTTTERSVMGQVCTLKRFHMRLRTAPGAGNSFAFTMRVNAGSGNQTITISNTDLTGADLVNTDVLADFDLVSLQAVPASLPAVGNNLWSCVCDTGEGGADPPILGAQLCAGNFGAGYTPFFGGTSIADLCFDLSVTMWKETIEPGAFVLPRSR